LFLFLIFCALASSPVAAANTDIRLNSIGFITNGPKLATIDVTASSFTVVNASTSATAFSGTPGAAFTDTETSTTVQVLDFSSLTTAGSYYVNVPGVGQSATFSIGDDVYNGPLSECMAGFLMWRCGEAVSCTFNGTTWSHGACHTTDGDTSLIGGGTKNGAGGWHDAGDYGKYTLNGAFAAGMLLQAWEQFSGNISNYVLQMPSHISGMPDYLTEVKYELDFLLKMQLPSGAVADKLVPSGFPAGPSYSPAEIMPEADTGTRYFVPASSHATASFCAIMAKASRIYQAYDAASAANYLAAANSAYAWLQANPNGLWPTSGEGYCGDYTATTSGQLPDGPARLWAAAEVWDATGSSTALADVEARIAARPSPVVDFNWDWGDPGNSASLGNLGIFTYLLNPGNQSGRSSTLVASATADCLSVANTIVSNSQAHAYGRGLGVYYWGCNGTVARQVMNLMVANQLSPSASYTKAALAQLDHILGRNYYDRSYVTGIGINPPVNPHDRLSAADGITNPVPGRLVGGGWPNATSWVDAIGDYQYNEVALNWNAPVVYAEAAFCVPQKTPTPTATATTTPCTTSYERINCGATASFKDHLGQTWVADQAYSVGTSGSYGYVTWAAGAVEGAVTNTISNTSDPTLYQTGRYGTTTLEYRFNVANGNYHVRLCFAEIYYSATQKREFNVAVQGNTVATNLDLVAASGAEFTAYDIIAPAVVTNGYVDILLTAGAYDDPVINAIELLQDGACPSPTFTPNLGTATFTRTATATVSRTSTITPAFSPTSSATATTYAGTPTFTQTLTPSATQSPSPSATETRTPSATPSLSASASQTPSASATPVPVCQMNTLYRVNCGGPAYTGNGNTWAADQAYSTSTGWGYIGGSAETIVTNPIANTTDDTLYQSGCWGSTLEYKFAVPNGNYSVYMMWAEINFSSANSRVFNVSLQGSQVISGLDIFSAAGGEYIAYGLTRTCTVSNGILDITCSSVTDDAKFSALQVIQDLACTPTSTQSPVGSATFTATPSRTASPSPTLSFSPTATSTQSPSPSASATPSGSPTASASATRSPTATASATASASPSATGSSTRSPSSTLSATPSLSFTSVPTNSTLTDTPTITPTPSPSSTASPSPTATATASVSPSPTGTATPSATATPSNTATASATGTPTPTWTPTFTDVPLGSTRTDTPTLSPTPSASATASATSSTTPSLTAGPSGTADPTQPPAGGESPTLLKAYSLPNPVVPGLAPRLAIQAQGRASGLEIRAYSKNLVQALDLRLAFSLQRGWNTSPALDLRQLPTGVSFLRVRAFTANGQAGNWLLVPVVILR
jgi:endoglucanase